MTIDHSRPFKRIEGINNCQFVHPKWRCKAQNRNMVKQTLKCHGGVTRLMRSCGALYMIKCGFVSGEGGYWTLNVFLTTYGRYTIGSHGHNMPKYHIVTRFHMGSVIYMYFTIYVFYHSRAVHHWITGSQHKVHMYQIIDNGHGRDKQPSFMWEYNSTWYLWIFFATLNSWSRIIKVLM